MEGEVRKAFRKAWVEIDLGSIYDNVTSYRRHISPNKALMAVVKGNAYGHGAVPVAKEALAAGAAWLAVALLEEALELRDAGIQAPILLFGYCPEEYIYLAQQNHITLSFNDKDSLRRAVPYIEKSLPQLQFHLKLDTGMRRLGLQNQEELHTFISFYRQALGQGTNIHWQGAYTHFATADELDQTYAKKQLQEFEQQLQIIQKEGLALEWIHAENSAAAIQFPEINTTNLVRLGISMYGLYPSQEMRPYFPFSLKPAFSFHTVLSQVKKVAQNSGISYGLAFTTEKDEWIGTLPVGYADGWKRSLSNQVSVLIQGKKLKQVGRICMDQCMVLLDQEYPLREPVTLIGRQGEQEISIDDLAQVLNTINYEIPCMISTRVPRRYYKYGQQLL